MITRAFLAKVCILGLLSGSFQAYLMNQGEEKNNTEIQDTTDFFQPVTPSPQPIEK